MKTVNAIYILILIVLLVTVFFLWQNVRTLENEISGLQSPDLYTVMGQMQNQIHKLHYSLDEENLDLADFYIHELEEATESLIEADVVYHGEQVGELTQTMLLPVLEQLAGAVDAGDIEQSREQAAALVQSCNNCHQSTGYGAIRMTGKAGANPFNQDFGGQ